MRLSRSAQTCALGSAIAGAVVGGAHRSFAATQRAMTGLKPKAYRPDRRAQAVYPEVYGLYRQLHDAFGTHDAGGNLFGVMKQLLEIRNRVRR